MSGSHDVPGRRQGVGRSGGWQWARGGRRARGGPRRAPLCLNFPRPESAERADEGRETRPPPRPPRRRRAAARRAQPE